MSSSITGLSYATWEQDCGLLAQVAAKFKRTGLLDARYLRQASAIESSIEDELLMVDDLCELSDPDTAGLLGDVRARLAQLKRQVHEARELMGQLYGPAPASDV